MKQPMFKRSALAQAAAFACLSVAASLAQATPICAGGIANYNVALYGTSIQDCHITGTLQVIADLNSRYMSYVYVSPSQYLVTASAGNIVRSGNASTGVEVRALTLYTGEGVLNATSSIGTLTNHDTLSNMASGVSVFATGAGSGGGAIEPGSSHASIGTLSNDGTITSTLGSGISVTAKTVNSNATIGTISNAASGVISTSNFTVPGDAGISVMAQTTSLATAVQVSAAHASVGLVDNNGQISGANGIAVSALNAGSQASITTVSNHAGGRIQGTGVGISVSGTPTLGTEASIHSVVNQGEISGAVNGIAVGASGRIDEIVNQGPATPGSNGVISGGTGAAINVTGGQVGVIRNTGTISGTSGIVVAGGTVPLGINNDDTGTIAATSGKAIDLSTAGSNITVSNSGLIQGNVDLGNGAALQPSTGPVLNLNGTNARIVGSVAGGDASTVNVNGAFLTEGTFNVGRFNINDSAVLTMRHDISAAAGGMRNNGTLFIPADAAVTITGNYLQGAGGLLETGVTSASTFGRLTVTGDADLSASNRMAVRVTPQDTLVPGAVMPNVIQAQGVLTAGAVTVADNSALWNFTARRNGDKGIDLVAALAVAPEPEPVPVAAPVPVPAPRVGVTPMIENTGIGLPALGAAGVIDRFLVAGNASGDMQTVLDALGALGTQREVAGAVGQMVPALTGGMAQASMGAMHSTNRVVQARMESARGLSSGDALKISHGWVKTFGSWAKQGDRNSVAGYDADTYGFVLGADSELSATARAGAAFAYSHTRVDGNTGLQRAKVDTYQAIAYASHSLDAVTDINVQADVGMNRNDADRDLRFGGVNRTASASYNSWNTHVGVGIGRILDIAPKTTFTPSVRADYLYIRDRGYTETGAGALNLNVNGKSADELVIAIDGKVNHALTDTLSLTANLGAGYDALASRSSITTSFVGGGAAFVTEGLDPSRWLTRGGVGLSSTYANGLELSVRYDVEARRSFTAQTASLKVRMPF